jgi:hypothetical protein
VLRFQPFGEHRHSWIGYLLAWISVVVPTPGYADDETLARLLVKYREYGLPMPSRDAQLVLRQHGGSVVGGVPQYRYDLALQDKLGGKVMNWIGTVAERPSGTIKETIQTPTAEHASKSETAYLTSHVGGDQHIDLVLAIHCQDKGWKELAQALLSRSRTLPRHRSADRRRERPQDDQAALALAAWDYWCEQFIREPGDRQPIIARLKTLAAGKLRLSSKAKLNLIADMELTLTKRPKPASELEAAIDSLIDLGGERNDHNWFPPSVESASRSHRGYARLRDAGFEAVPVLIAHLDDHRLTRCMGSSRRGAWHARIADAVAVLLDGLATEPFSYDLLVAEGRGRQLDRAHVVHWWMEAQGTKALDYLKSHAVTVERRGEPEANEAILQALGQRYPGELVELFPEKLPLVTNSYPLFKALEDSRATKEEKVRLLLAAAKDKESSNRIRAIYGLLALQHEQAVPLLVHEIESFPHTPKKPYWLCDARDIPKLVVRSKDDRAWNAMRAMSKRVDIGQRMELIAAAGRCSRDEARVIDFLGSFLRDHEVRVITFPIPESPIKAGELEKDLFLGPCAGFIWHRLAVRDLASVELARHLHIDIDDGALQREKDWDELRIKVAAGLAARTKKNAEAKK